MGAFYDEIPVNPDLRAWIAEQRIFWVATAPLRADGHVNVSPKGTVDTLHIESPKLAWYEDLSGSGAETFAHLQENGRLTLLFTAFVGPPRIVRLFGTGRACLRGSPEYHARIPPGTERPGSRAIVVVDIHKVGSSCGYSIPEFDFVREREVLNRWAAKKEATTDFAGPIDEDESLRDLRQYWITRTTKSIDGLPGIGQHYLPESKKEAPVASPTACASKATSISKTALEHPKWTTHLSLVGSHLLAACLAGALVHAQHLGLVDLKLIGAFLAACVAWVAGQAVGAPVPAPCCAVGL